MPVLAIGDDKSLGEVLGQQMNLAATTETVVVLKNTKHRVMEERPKETTEAYEIPVRDVLHNQSSRDGER